MNATLLSKKSLDVIQKSKKIAVIATGVIAAATGLYMLFRKTEEQPSFVGDVDIEYNKEYLTVVTIRQVNKACLKKIFADYKNLVCEYRKKRREIIGDLEKYIQTCLEYNKNLESLISEGRKEVLKHLEISEQMWDDSISYYIKKNNSKVMMLCATFQANLKERIESQITLSIQQFSDVLIQHTEFLKQEEGMINKIQAITRDKQKAVEIFETLIHDQIYARFRIEEEDFFAAMNNLAGLPEIQVAAMEFIREINRLSISSLRTSQSFLLAKKI